MKALATNHGAFSLPLRIYIDGPRIDSDIADVCRVVSVSKQCSGFESIQIIERPTNLGLYASLTLGVSEALLEYESALVFEDDLYTSPWCLSFLLDGLSAYREHPKVASIHAYTPPLKKDLPTTFFLPGADCWGWATWRDRWQLFRHDANNMANEIKFRNLRFQFDLNGNQPFYQMLCDRGSGKNNSWAICWYASCFLANKLTLYPGKSLVRNIGLDNSGENCGPIPLMESKLSMNPVPVEFLETKVDPVVFSEYANHFHCSPFEKTLTRIKSSLTRLPFFTKSFSLIALVFDLVRAFSLRIKHNLYDQIFARYFSRSRLILRGRYNSFHDALSHSTGYSDSVILEKVSNAVICVLKGYAAYERDGSIFPSIPNDLKIRELIIKLAKEGDSIIDYGGGLGGTYLCLQDALPDLAHYIIVEQPNFVELGKSIAAQYNIPVSFTANLAQVNCQPSIVVASSVLQYLSDPYQTLMSIAKLKPKHIILDRLGFVRPYKNSNLLYSLQDCSDHIKTGSLIPFALLEKGKILNILRFHGYEFVESWLNPFDPSSPTHKGFLFTSLEITK